MLKIQYDHQMFDLQVYGGISRYFFNLIAGIDQTADFEAEVSVLYTENYYLKHHRPWALNNVVGRCIFSNKRRIAKWNKNYSRYCLQRNNFDVFHPTYYNPYFLKLLKKPLVITVHDMIYELYPDYFTAVDFTARNKRLLVAAATHIIAISETTKRDLIKLLDVPEDKITVVYHGHTPIINQTKPDILFPPDYLVFVGGRADYKNFSLFAKGAALVMEKHPLLKLVCAGGGKFTVEEQRYLQQLGLLDKCVHYDVTDAQLYWLYKGAKAFIYPSLYEGFGLPVLEAFEAGCPVVLSDTPSFKEVAGEAAIYFDATDHKSIAESINRLLDHPEQCSALIAAGQSRLKKFSMEQCIAATLEVYKKCV